MFDMLDAVDGRANGPHRPARAHPRASGDDGSAWRHCADHHRGPGPLRAAPRALPRVGGGSGAGGPVAQRDHELLALRAAHNCRSPFEWHEHAAFARQAGLTDDEIDRVAAGSDTGWAPHELALLRAADELHRDTTISHATWTLLLAHYGTAELVEAVYVVGQYTMLSMVANVVEAE